MRLSTVRCDIQPCDQQARRQIMVKAWVV